MQEPLQQSWFGVVNFATADTVEPWQTAAVLREVQHRQARAAREPELTPPNPNATNSTTKVRLEPTLEQRKNLEQMFATNRAVYKKLVARTRQLCERRVHSDRKYRPAKNQAIRLAPLQ